MRLFLAAACAFIAVITTGFAQSADVPGDRDRQSMMRRIAESWLVTQQPDGFLPYGFDFLRDRATDDPTSSAYIVRQAGSFWGWARYYAHTGDERYREAIRRGLATLAQHSLPIGKSRLQAMIEQTRMLSTPVGRLTLAAALRSLELLYRPSGSGKIVSPDGLYSKGWTGATALALLAELTYAKASGDTSFAALRAAWRDGLLSLRIPGGGFRESPTSIDDSDYFNGETWLALAYYADVHPDDAVIARVLPGIDDALMRQYGARPSNTFYQWGAMAAAQRWRTTRDDRFIDYLMQQALVFTDRFRSRFGEDANNCAPMEGLVVTQGVLAESGRSNTDAARQVDELLVREIAKLPKLQIQPGQREMKLGGEARLVAPNIARFEGGFMFGLAQPQTRVDAAQHCLSALILLEENDARRTKTSSPPPRIRQ